MDYKLLRVLSRVVITVDDDDEIVDEVKAQIRGMMTADHRFAGMCRFFVKKKWKLNID